MKKLALAVCLACAATSPFTGDNINVIVSKETSKAEKIKEVSIPDMIDIFTRRKTLWDSGMEIVVVTRHQNTSEHLNFLYSKLGITPYQYRTRLERNIYKGRTKPPIVVNSDDEVVEVVLSVPGAIGYIHNYYIYKNGGKLVIIQNG